MASFESLSAMRAMRCARENTALGASTARRTKVSSMDIHVIKDPDEWQKCGVKE
jgi:hypothetical protein